MSPSRKVNRNVPFAEGAQGPRHLTVVCDRESARDIDPGREDLEDADGVEAELVMPMSSRGRDRAHVDVPAYPLRLGHNVSAVVAVRTGPRSVTVVPRERRNITERELDFPLLPVTKADVEGSSIKSQHRSFGVGRRKGLTQWIE
jgi:hypothetical protein